MNETSEKQTVQLKKQTLAFPVAAKKIITLRARF